MSTGTWGMLSKTQQKVRIIAKTKADGYINTGPRVGGRYGEKSFPATDRKGGNAMMWMLMAMAHRSSVNDQGAS